MYTQFDHFSADTLVDIPNDTLNISFEKHIEYDESEWITFEEINSQQDEEMEEDEVQFSKQEQAIMDKQAAEVGKHLERYLRKSIPINVPKLGTSSSSEVVYPQNAEIESKLFGQGYFKLGTKVTLDENELKKTNQVRETDKFIAQNSIIQNIEKRELAPTLKVEKLKKKETAGKGWFDMEAPIMTPELEQELIALQLRHATRGASKTKLEPQQQELPKFFQIGTVIEGPGEFYSSRLKRKERRQNFLDELLAEEETKSYVKKRYNEIQKEISKSEKRKRRKLKK